MVCHQAELSLRPSTKGFVIGLVLKAVQLHFSGTKNRLRQKFAAPASCSPPNHIKTAASTMGFFGYSEATNPCERAVTKMIKLPNISEDTRVLLGQIQKEIKLNPDAYTMGILVDKITHLKEIDVLRSVISVGPSSESRGP